MTTPPRENKELLKESEAHKMFCNYIGKDVDIWHFRNAKNFFEYTRPQPVKMVKFPEKIENLEFDESISDLLGIDDDDCQNSCVNKGYNTAIDACKSAFDNARELPSEEEIKNAVEDGIMKQLSNEVVTCERFDSPVVDTIAQAILELLRGKKDQKERINNELERD